MSNKALNIITNILGIITFLFGGYLAYLGRDFIPTVLGMFIVGYVLIQFKNPTIKKWVDLFVIKKTS